MVERRFYRQGMTFEETLGVLLDLMGREVSVVVTSHKGAVNIAHLSGRLRQVSADELWPGYSSGAFDVESEEAFLIAVDEEGGNFATLYRSQFDTATLEHIARNKDALNIAHGSTELEINFPPGAVRAT